MRGFSKFRQPLVGNSQAFETIKILRINVAPSFEKISRLPPVRVAEVEDFLDSIAQGDTDRELVRASARASEFAFSKAWSNPEDDVYDRTA